MRGGASKAGGALSQLTRPFNLPGATKLPIGPQMTGPQAAPRPAAAPAPGMPFSLSTPSTRGGPVSATPKTSAKRGLTRRFLTHPATYMAGIPALGVTGGLGLSVYHNHGVEAGQRAQRFHVQQEAGRDSNIGRRLQRAHVLHHGAPQNVASPDFVYQPTGLPNPNRAYHF